MSGTKPKLNKFIDDEAEEDKLPQKEKQTTFSMAVPPVTPDKKLPYSKTSNVSGPCSHKKKAARLEPHITSTPDFGHHPKWGETPEELRACINFETPDGQDALGNILDLGDNNNTKIVAKAQVNSDHSEEKVNEEPSEPKAQVNSDHSKEKVNEEASEPISILLAKRPLQNIDSNDASSDDSMADFVSALARPSRQFHYPIKNTGYVYYEHLHGGLTLFRVEDSENGRDAFMEQAIHGLDKPVFKDFKVFPGWLSLHANTNDKLKGNREPYFARAIVLFKGSIKSEAAKTTDSFLKTLTNFMNDWTFISGQLKCVKHEGGHWYHYQPLQGLIDRTPKNKKKLGDMICTNESLFIVKSIATEIIGYSSENYMENKKFTTMYFNPPYTPAIMTSLHMDTAQG